MEYEEGLGVSWDESSKITEVVFRGETTELGQYATFEKATQAAEDFCRTRGWQGLTRRRAKTNEGPPVDKIL